MSYKCENCGKVDFISDIYLTCSCGKKFCCNKCLNEFHNLKKEDLKNEHDYCRY
jgi:hypothetical protein